MEKSFVVTRQRRIILEELRAMGTHPTAGELYDVIRRRLPHISLATVYRNLELLADKGLIQTLVTDGRQKRFDMNPATHCHAYCVRCGAVRDIIVDQDVISLLKNGRNELENFEILDARVEFSGLCNECRFQKKINDPISKRLSEGT